MNRRDILKCTAAGALAVWAAPRRLSAQQAAVRKLTGRVSIIEAGGVNIVALAADGGLIVVESGPQGAGAQVTAALNGIGGKVQTLFNTHYHLDQTANNEMFASSGAKIVAHERTKQWMATDYYVPSKERYEKARPKGSWPTQTFLTTGSMKTGAEEIDYGHLLLAHTSGDIYVHFKTSNVLAVGDVSSPVRDPEFDYFTGAWIGGRVDAMDVLLGIANDQTLVVPAYGPVLSKAEFKAERDMMEEVRARLFKQVREGDGPQDMLDGGVLKGLPREWKDPYKFLYDAAKGLWGHHNKLDANVV